MYRQMINDSSLLQHLIMYFKIWFDDMTELYLLLLFQNSIIFDTISLRVLGVQFQYWHDCTKNQNNFSLKWQVFKTLLVPFALVRGVNYIEHLITFLRKWERRFICLCIFDDTFCCKIQYLLSWDILQLHWICSVCVSFLLTYQYTFKLERHWLFDKPTVCDNFS